MDIEGIDVAVMYGTRGRQILCHDDLAPDYAAALAHAYNKWAADYCKADPRRLKFAAQIAMHDVKSAVEEARRCVSELGAVAVIGTPNPVNGQHLHDEVCEPLWNELEDLNVPIGFHPTGTTSLRDDAGRRYVAHANFHPIAHAIRNPVELMGAIASMTTGGVLELPSEAALRFSRGRPGGCIGGCGNSMTNGRSSAPAVSTSYRCCRVNTSSVNATSRSMSTRTQPSMSSTRWALNISSCRATTPHSDGAFPDAMNEFFGMPLNSEQRRKIILWENCARLYAIETPSQALTAPQASAAE